MVAKGMPIGIKPKPPQPRDDAEELRRCLDLMRRNQIAAIKLTERVLALVEKQIAA